MVIKSKRQARKKITGVDPKNRMNDLNSRQWLPFQKSWFTVEPEEHPHQTITGFIEFFTKRINEQKKPSTIAIFQENANVFIPVIKSLGRRPVVLEDDFSETSRQFDYCLVDLCEIFTNRSSYLKGEKRWLKKLAHVHSCLKPKAYFTVLIRNVDAKGSLLPLAWNFGLAINQFATIKDEKIGCDLTSLNGKHFSTYFKSTASEETTTRQTNGSAKTKSSVQKSRYWKTQQNTFYCLNFRKKDLEEQDASPTRIDISPKSTFLTNQKHHLPKSDTNSGSTIISPSSWFVAKPPPREKNVLLHPAKFPETLVEFFLQQFSQEGENIFDPMAGTGSTILSALSCGRQAYGIELSSQFHQIVKERVKNYAALHDKKITTLPWRVVRGDAASATSYKRLPESFDYVLTSPPYWDMLKMKGAETQKKRKKAGLLQFYSDDKRDVGNIEDYETFLRNTVNIYKKVAERLAPGRYMTIIVKNVKKKGTIYPLAWDLALRLSEDLILCHEQFWCQDDQRIGPFGYRYAWVSNTFHHYCLHFQKPEK